MPSEASVKFFDETFFQKSFDLALDLSGRQPEKKLGKQRSVFPGRRSASAVNSRLGAVSYAHACANHRCTCAPGAGCPLRHANGMTPPPKGEARLSFLQAFGGAPTWLPLRGPLRPGGTLPSGSGDRALDGAHWAPAPLPAFFRESWAKNFTRLRRPHPVCTAT